MSAKSYGVFVKGLVLSGADLDAVKAKHALAISRGVPQKLAGQKRGKLLLLSRRRNECQPRRRYVYLVQCDCGTIKEMREDYILAHPEASCWCGVVERVRKHGLSGSRAYGVWRSMLHRCRAKTCKAYRWYGARGITVCERWLQFNNFLADMGHPPIGLEIERINNDGNYERSNCRWATVKEQNRNRRSRRLLTFNGQTMCVSAWAELKNMQSETLYRRLNKGWGIDRALNSPIKGNNVLRLTEVS